MNIKEKAESIINFYKEAFCVDGEVKILRKSDNLEISSAVELNDSKRGKFFVGALREKVSNFVC